MTATRIKSGAPKRSRRARLLLMGVAPLALTACEQQQEAMLYTDVDSCIAARVQTAAECESAYREAVATSETTAPKYTRREDCVADFGEAQCRPSSSGGFFMPFMTGYLVGNLLQGGRVTPQPAYRPRNGEWSTAGGYTIGRQPGRVVVDPAATKPQRAITQSRAGFGSRAAARGSWGG